MRRFALPGAALPACAVAAPLGALAVLLLVSRPAGADPIPHLRGGGWIAWGNPEDSPNPRATFGVQVRALGGPDTFEGHFEYHDHAAGLRIRLDRILDFEVSGNRATFVAEGTVGGAPGACTVMATDNDAPGRRAAKVRAPDALHVECGAYRAYGPLGGGNITILDPNQIGEPNQ